MATVKEKILLTARYQKLKIWNFPIKNRAKKNYFNSFSAIYLSTDFKSFNIQQHLNVESSTVKKKQFDS